MEIIKLCQHCKENKSIEEFGFYKKYKDGRNVICKECNVSKLKKYRETEKYKLYITDYYKREEVIKRQKEYSSEYIKVNKEKINIQKNKWTEENKNKLKAQKKEYRKMKKNTDPIYRLHQIISAMIRKSLNYSGFKKNSRTHDILGCSFEEFKIYLESKFEDWMTWENRGLYNGELKYGWDIDHIIPLSTAETEEDVIKLNHYTNLQPLCSKFNRDIKKDNYENYQY